HRLRHPRGDTLFATTFSHATTNAAKYKNCLDATITACLTLIQMNVCGLTLGRTAASFATTINGNRAGCVQNNVLMLFSFVCHGVGFVAYTICFERDSECLGDRLP